MTKRFGYLATLPSPNAPYPLTGHLLPVHRLEALLFMTGVRPLGFGRGPQCGIGPNGLCYVFIPA